MRLSSGRPAPASGATPNRRLLKLAVPVGVGLVLWWMFAVVLAQEPAATVENYGFRLSCDTSVSEGSTLACTLTNTTDTAAEWPVVGIIHLSNDADRALVVGEPVDVAFGSLTSSPDIEDGVWWIGDVLVGYSRFDWSGQAAASSDSETTDTRTVNITAVDDTAWEESESFYITLGAQRDAGSGLPLRQPSASDHRPVGLQEDGRHPGQSHDHRRNLDDEPVCTRCDQPLHEPRIHHDRDVHNAHGHLQAVEYLGGGHRGRSRIELHHRGRPGEQGHTARSGHQHDRRHSHG